MTGAAGAIVLTGGRASRLGGADKAGIAVAGRPMLETVVRAAAAVADAVVTVGPGGDTCEEPPYSGPVAGIAAGLAALLQHPDRFRGRTTTIDETTLEGMRELGRHEGLFVAPEGAAVWMAARQLLTQGWLRPDERILLLNTGSGQKYMSNVAGRAWA